MKNKISMIMIDYKRPGRIIVIRGGENYREYAYTRTIKQAFYVAGYNGYKVVTSKLGKKSYIIPNP